MTKAPQFELQDLRLFAVIADEGSLSRAANALPLALSAASARLRLLEERLGLPLFIRHATGVTLTEAGKAFHPHALRILRAAGDAQAEMDGRVAVSRETLSLWANTTATSTVLPDLLGRFLAAHPYLDVTLVERPSAQVVQAILRGEADVGVIDAETAHPGLDALPMARYRLAVLAPGDHELAGQESCGFREVTRYPQIGLPEGSAMQLFLARMARMMAVEPFIRVRAPSFAAIARLVASGAGLAVVPEEAGRDYRDSLGLALIGLSDDWASRELQVSLRSWEASPPMVRALARSLAGLA